MGPAEPAGANLVERLPNLLAVDQQVKRNIELVQAVRATAYFLWEQDGRPEGLAFEYWVRAKEFHLRELAYDRWLAEGSPHGRDLDIWVQVSGEIDQN